MEKIDEKLNKLWKLSRTLRGKRSNIPNILTHNDAKLLTNAESLAHIFEQAHTTTITSTHAHDTKVEQFIRNFKRNRPFTTFPPILPNEIANALGTLKPHKAPGSDCIPNILLKNLPESLLDKISEIFNVCIKLNHWPRSFKTAKVIPIPKTGKDNRLAASSCRR